MHDSRSRVPTVLTTSLSGFLCLLLFAQPAKAYTYPGTGALKAAQ